MGTEYKKYANIKPSPAFAVTTSAFPGTKYLNLIVMALPQPQHALRRYILFITAAILCCTLGSCQHHHKIFTSNCDLGIHFRQVSFRRLMDSIESFDHQYVEVSGKYREDKELSALFSDNGPIGSGGLWVNFSQDCPLYLSGTHQGLFEFNDGGFTQINNQFITIRGRIYLHNKNSKYKATIDRVSLVKL
jgi:hypothetical protein